MYIGNGPKNDWFYERLRDRVKFALIGCGKACPDSFCVDMGSIVNEPSGNGRLPKYHKALAFKGSDENAEEYIMVCVLQEPLK